MNRFPGLVPELLRIVSPSVFADSEDSLPPARLLVLAPRAAERVFVESLAVVWGSFDHQRELRDGVVVDTSGAFGQEAVAVHPIVAVVDHLEALDMASFPEEASADIREGAFDILVAFAVAATFVVVGVVVELLAAEREIVWVPVLGLVSFWALEAT